MATSRALALWRSLDASAAPAVSWRRRPQNPRCAVLLGAFDPPTDAHIAIVRAAAAAQERAPVLCVTQVVLARPPDPLLDDEARIDILDGLAERLGLGLAFANRGTYLDVGRALASSGVEATFVIGADKLEQLCDPSFYEDGDRGVEATFAELDFVVVPRDDIPVGRPDVVVLDVRDVFADPSVACISATEVRRRVRAKQRVDDLVPAEVALAVGGYTSAR